MAMTPNERFTVLWTEAQPVVGSYINSLVRDYSAAEDLLQNVALVLFRRFSEYDSSRPFVAWALGVARNQVLSLYRDNSRSVLVFHPDLLEMIEATYVEMAPELEARKSALQDCLNRIQGRARQVVDLRYFEDLKPQEIGRRLGVESGAVRVMLNRTRQFLRECIERRTAGELS